MVRSGCERLSPADRVGLPGGDPGIRSGRNESPHPQMIVGSSLTIEIGDRTLLATRRSWSVPARRSALVGRNGTGKSTFISVVVDEPGRNVRSPATLVSAAPTATSPRFRFPHGLGLEPIGFSHVLSGRGLDVLDDALGKRPAPRWPRIQPPRTSSCSPTSRSSSVRTAGYEAESTMARLADGLGLRQELLLEDIDSLSGGQRRRVDLIRILFQGPDTMILDEPTNHLDLPAKTVADGGAGGVPGGHPGGVPRPQAARPVDRQGPAPLPTGVSTSSRGPTRPTWSSWRPTRSQRERSAQLEGREIERLSTLADSMRGSTNRRARIAKSLDKRVERLESGRTEVHRREKKSSFSLPTPKRSGEVPLRVVDLTVRYGANTVLEKVAFHNRRGDRTVIIGRNGAGKSSLLRCLAGVQEPTAGSVELGANVTLGYFAQEHEQVDLGVSVLDNIDDTILVSETERRALLGSFGIAGKAAHQMPKTLSGGERAKLGLAMLAAGRANVLLLDEPTNNLDPSSIEAVGSMLSRWSGTIVVVSHDRSFVDALQPTHCLKLPDEVFTHWDDDYLDQVEMK